VAGLIASNTERYGVIGWRAGYPAVVRTALARLADA